MKKRSLGFMLAALTLLTAGAAVPARAQSATWRVVEFHADQQVSVDCGVGLLCEIRLQPGERVRGGLGSLVELWDNHLVYDGTSPETPHLVVKPESTGLHENVLITTSRRVYHLFLNSTNSTSPTYLRFVYGDQERAEAHHAARLREIAARRERAARPVPTARPITTIEQACASIRQPKWTADSSPAEFRPRAICESTDHTFVALPLGKTEPTDLPVPFAETADGERPVNYRYDAASRVFTIDGTAPSYVLLATAGKHSVRMRIARVDVRAEVKK